MARLEADERLHAAWLVDLDGTPRDASGLPEAAVAAHLVVTEPGLGEMPVGLPEARARAWLAADDEERRRAAAVAQPPYSFWSQNGWRLQELQQQIRCAVVTDLLKFAYDRATTHRKLALSRSGGRTTTSAASCGTSSTAPPDRHAFRYGSLAQSPARFPPWGPGRRPLQGRPGMPDRA